MNHHFKVPQPAQTTQAAEGLPRHMWSVADIEAMTELGIFSEDDRFELIGGEIVPMSPKGNRHEIYKIALNQFWVQHKSKGYVIAQETTFRLNSHSFIEPDFVFYDGAVKRQELSPANTWLAVEISDTTLAYDLGRKPRIYSNAGVRALWVIDVNTLDTHVFAHPGIDGFKTQGLVRPTETLAPDFAPELALTLAGLELI